MAFTTDNEKLYREINHGICERDSVLSHYTEQIKRFHGPGYGPSEGEDELGAVNFAATWLAVMLPRLVHRNPKALVRTRKSLNNDQNSVEEAARATEAFLNVWVKNTTFAKKLKRCAMDYAFAWSCGMVTRRKHPGDPSMDTEVDRYIPEFVRIPVWRMVIDPYCEGIDEARYIGHTWYADKEDLVKMVEDADEDEGWDVEAVKAMQTETNAFKSSRLDPHDKKEIDREEVMLVDVWFPEKLHDEDLGPEDGFHGTIMTLGWDKNQQTVYHFRKPRPCFCPPTGPYALGGYMQVPMKVFPAGPLMLAYGHETLLREMVHSANQGCLDYKKCWLIPAGTGAEDAAHKVLGSDEVVIPVPGMPAEAKPIEIEIGGVTDIQLRNIAYTRAELERHSGFDGPGVGEANKDTTATSDAIADQARQTISSHIVDNFHEFVREILEKVAWYGFSDEEISVRITEDIDGLEDADDPRFEGGPGELDLSDFSLMTIDIEPLSMERTNEAMHQQRVLQVFGLIGQLAPMIRQLPEVDWKAVISMLGDALNMPNMDQLIDIDMAMQMMGVPVQPDQGDGLGVQGVDAGFNPRAQERQTAGKAMGQILGQVAGVA